MVNLSSSVDIIRSTEGDFSFIPKVPETYCFVNENFLSESFSVDGFVRRNSKRVTSLETFKEHLTAYLKILKQAMINLINEDYIEFINLSANLVSFDKSIQNIKTPVLKFKNETSNVKFKIEEIIVSIKAKQERLKAIRESKQKLRMILEIIEYLDRIEANIEKIDLKIELYQYDLNLKKFHIYPALSENSTLVARVNLNFNCLLGSAENRKHTGNNQFLSQLKQRFDSVCQKFYETLENEVLFLLNYDRMKLKDEIFLSEILTMIEQLFVLYLIDGNKTKLEIVIRNNIVKPCFDEIICDTHMSKNELENMFARIINVIGDKCFLLIKILSTSKIFQKFKFEIIISTIWNTFVNLFLVRTPLLANLSDPETFQENYFLTFKFIEQFLNKTLLSDYRPQFEQQKSFIQLKSKFKLNVYFHMKLQKISINLENSFDKLGYSVIDGSKNSIFRLDVTKVAYENIMDCWQISMENFYIGDLFVYLWKLTLKILSRVANWIVNIDLNNINLYLVTKNNNLTETNIRKLVRQILSFVISDSYAILNEFTKLFNSVIQPLWDSYFVTRLSPKMANNNSDQMSQIEYSSLRHSFDEAIQDFQSSAINQTIFIIKVEIIEECKQLLNHVNDIPRLYRRTNKEKPREASSYICKCVGQLVECIQMIGFGPNINNKSSNQWLNDILNDLAQHYKQLTLEVLTSVQKTEDSLKKLKKLKVNSGLLSSANTSMSDDDKIRLQIYYDVKRFGKEIEDKLKIDVKSIKPYHELLETINSLKILQ